MVRLLLVSLLAVLGVWRAAGGHGGRNMPGQPRNISADDGAVRRLVLDAAALFNNQSNDAFLFKSSAVLKAQRQIVRGLRYLVDLQISRTICRKQENSDDLSKCDFQPAGPLRQTFQCHFEVWVVPWRKQMKTLFFRCKS